MAGSDRAISVLKLFTLEKPAWTVDAVSAALNVSVSTAYRYVAALVEAGLLTAGRDGQYVLGPAIIQYDRQIQLTDPLLNASSAVMSDILRYAPPGSVVLLCRLFHDTVLCIHQIMNVPHATEVSYARGRPMPLLKGATSKIMLPYLPSRELLQLHRARAGEIHAAGLGASWEDFRAKLSEMRRQGYVITYSEVDPNLIGIGAAILDDQRRLLGSLSYVIPATETSAATRLGTLLKVAAREIEVRLSQSQDAGS
jgi:DNA-binding IclR family transcriptional regulator